MRCISSTLQRIRGDGEGETTTASQGKQPTRADRNNGERLRCLADNASEKRGAWETTSKQKKATKLVTSERGRHILKEKCLAAAMRKVT